MQDKKTIINPYLHFDGNCREAFDFYNKCFGGELNIQTIGDSPMAKEMPEKSHNKVMHANLSKDGVTLLLGADMMMPESFTIGDTVSISLNCKSEEEINDLFSKLSSGGKVDHELSEEFWGATFGMFTDKFGIDWMLNYDKSNGNYEKEKSM